MIEAGTWIFKLIKLRLAILLFGFVFTAYGQHEFASIQLPEKNIENYLMVADDEGRICLHYYKKSFLYFFIIGQSGEILHQEKQPFKYAPNLLGGGYNSNSFIFYYQPRSTKKEGDIAAFTVNKVNGKFKEHSNFKIKSDKNEELIGHLSNGKDFFVFIASKDNNELKIAKLNESQPEIKSFQYQVPIVPSLMINGDFLYVDPIANKSIYSYQLAQKVYLQREKIYFTFDMPNQFKTYVWMINWKQGVSELIDIPQEKFTFGTSSNSVLYEKSLFRITVDKTRLDLSIYHIESRALIKSYSYTVEQPITLNNGPIYNEDETTGTFNTLSGVSNDKLYKIFSKGTASIYANRVNDSNIVLTLGAYNASSSGISIGGALGSFGKAGGIAIGGDKQLTGTKQGSTFFDAFLTYPDLDISPNPDLTTANDRIQTFLFSLKI